MSILKEAINKKKVLVSDGAWGTFLQEKGLRGDECPELWNLERKNDVLAVATGYVEAGADAILTNSFGGSRIKLESYGLGDKCYEINKAAAEISREAAGKEVLVLGSVGPTGKMLMMGEVSSEEMYESFCEQVKGLHDGGADAIVVETMSALDEAVLAIKAARENTMLEVICTMTFSLSPACEYRTMMGVSPSESVQPLLDAGASVLGANCGNGIDGMIDIVREIRQINPEVPLLVHANAGIPRLEDGKSVFPESPDEMGNKIKSLIDAGANIIGGCCGTTPEHIRKMVLVVENL